MRLLARLDFGLLCSLRASRVSRAFVDGHRSPLLGGDVVDHRRKVEAVGVVVVHECTTKSGSPLHSSHEWHSWNFMTEKCAILKKCDILVVVKDYQYEYE